MTTDESELDRHVARVVDSLSERFVNTHDRDTVEQAVLDARAHLQANARVTSYLPVLISRRAAGQLAGKRAATQP